MIPKTYPRLPQSKSPKIGLRSPYLKNSNTWSDETVGHRVWGLTSILGLGKFLLEVISFRRWTHINAIITSV